MLQPGCGIDPGPSRVRVNPVVVMAGACRGPFVPINVSNWDGAMFSYTLFAHLKCACTGAERERQGWVVTAAAGRVLSFRGGQGSDVQRPLEGGVASRRPAEGFFSRHYPAETDPSPLRHGLSSGGLSSARRFQQRREPISLLSICGEL